MVNALRTKICGKTNQKQRSLKKEFFECRRHSGSSGLTSVNTNFFKAIGSKMFLPRTTNACKIVKTPTQYFVYYKKIPKNTEVEHTSDFAEYTFTQPQIGGRTTFDSKLLNDFIWFTSFSASKYSAAVVMDFVNKSQNVCVEPDVISFAFNEVAELSHLVKQTSQSNRRIKLMMAYATRQNISLVGYPCCFHQDYTGTLPSLENKKCFEIKHWSNKGVGRGGGSAGTFVVALLDWTSHNSGGRRRDYLSLTGALPKDVPRVTEQMWVSQFGCSYDSFRNTGVTERCNDDDNNN